MIITPTRKPIVSATRPSVQSYDLVFQNMFGAQGNFETDIDLDGLADGWTGAFLASKSVAANIQTFTPSAVNGQIGKYISSDCTGVLYACCYVSCAPGKSLRLGNINGTGSPNNFTSIGDWQLVSNMQPCPVSDTQIYIRSLDTSSWSAIQVKRALLVNLTAKYGSGNEPSKAWCDENIPQNIIW